MKKEQLTYNEWTSEQKTPQFGVYIISGHHHWKQEFMSSMKELYNTDYTIINKDVDEHVRKLNYRPMGKKKHLLMFESMGRIPKTDLDELIQYVKKPSKYAIFVLSINNWQEKKVILNNFKYLDRSTTIKFFDLDFPRNRFVEDYITDVCKQHKVEFESKSDFDFLTRRLSSSTQDIVTNVQTLLTLKDDDEGYKITKEDIKKYTEDFSSYTYNKLYSSLTKLNRKTIPYIAYSDLLESGRKETTILINIYKHFNYLYQAKYLKLEGILRNDDIIEMKKHLYDKGSIKFKGNNNIFDLSDYKINYYLKESDHITLKDIIHVRGLITKNMPMVPYKAEGVPDEEIPKDILNRKFTSNEMVAFETILQILNRRAD